ncbi:MAG: hypothetical protein ACRECO_03685 [Xanthobacteraceae bacterium]
MSTAELTDDVDLSRRWRRWLITLVSIIAGTMALVYGGVLLLDPFSTGRFTPIKRIDIATKNITMGHVARVRDLRFDAAIVGNSHAVTFDPGRLSVLTGRTFAQLSSPGYGAREQFVVTRAFVRERRGRAPALVLVLDRQACAPDENLARFGDSFPDYLFEESRLNYLRRIFFPEAIRSAGYRLLMLMGFARDRQPRDGVDAGALKAMQGLSPRHRAEIEALRRPTSSPPHGAPFPAVAFWRSFLAGLDAETRLVLYFGPLPIGRLPLPGSAAEARLAACKAAYRKLAVERPHTVLIDRWIDHAFARDIGNFTDTDHFRSGLATNLEPEIAAALKHALSER